MVSLLTDFGANAALIPPMAKCMYQYHRLHDWVIIAFLFLSPFLMRNKFDTVVPTSDEAYGAMWWTVEVLAMVALLALQMIVIDKYPDVQKQTKTS